MSEQNCAVCNRSIWGIVNVNERIGTEKPTYLHTVCYERLKRNSDLFEKELERATDGLFYGLSDDIK